MDIIQLYRINGIQVAQPGDRGYHTGWVNVACPFCSGNAGFHLGFNLNSQYFYCWRCGAHSRKEVFRTLFKMNPAEMTAILKSLKPIRERAATEKKELKLPMLSDLNQYHRNYLIERKFDPDRIIKDWQIKSTMPGARIDRTDYSNRIFIPIYWNRELVTFQTRSHSTDAYAKYKACPIEYENVPHKSILYGNQSRWNGLAIIVEGVTDVWRLGSIAAATFGIEYKREQIREIALNFARVFILFDPESQAQKQAQKLKGELEFRGLEVYNINLKDRDPGELSDEEAREIVKNCQTYKLK